MLWGVEADGAAQHPRLGVPERQHLAHGRAHDTAHRQLCGATPPPALPLSRTHEGGLGLGSRTVPRRVLLVAGVEGGQAVSDNVGKEGRRQGLTLLRAGVANRVGSTRSAGVPMEVSRPSSGALIARFTRALVVHAVQATHLCCAARRRRW